MNYGYWVYATWLTFVVKYRKTILGPFWLMVGPILFIATIGLLYSRINNTAAQEFVPHLAVGLIVWTLISGFVNGSTTIFQRYRSQILQGELMQIDIAMVGVFTTVLQFLHQVVIILGVFIFYDVPISWHSLLSIPGLFLIIVNGVWLSIIFGIVGARFHDLTEVVTAIMRIGFLATPVIWLPGAEGRGGLMGGFLTYNPFYHFIEIVRAPLLGNSVQLLSWIVVIGFTLFGSAAAYFFYRKFKHAVPLWV